MNYTKLTINGVDYGLKFGMVSDRYIDRLKNKNYLFDNGDITELAIAHIIYSGHLNNCAIKDEVPTLTVEMLVDFVESNLLDESKMKEVGNVIKIWLDERAKKADTVNDDKKKQTTKKSKS